MSYRKFLSLTLFVGLAGWLIVTAVLMPHLAAVQLNDHAPTRELSDPTGSHTFFLRKQERAGQNLKLNLVAYFPTDNSWDGGWGNQYIQLRPGGDVDATEVCDTQGVPDADRFIKVILDAVNGGTRTFYIRTANVCDGNNQSHMNVDGEGGANRFFARYPLPSEPSNAYGQTGFYRVNVTVTYGGNVPTGTHGQGIRFDLEASSPRAKTMAQGNGEFPIIGDWGSRAAGSTTIDIPFGLACNADTAVYGVIGLKDADNDPSYGFSPLRVRFNIKDIKTGEIIPWDSGRNGTTSTYGNGITWFTPSDTNDSEDLASVRIRMKVGHKYVLQIRELAPRNTIVVSVPAETIYGDQDICNGPWEFDPQTSVSKDEIEVGETVNWMHTLENIGSEDAPVNAANWNVYQQIGSANKTSRGNGRTPSLGAGDSWRAGSYNYTAKTADIGKQICQWIEVRPYKEGVNATKSSTPPPHCVTVIGATDRKVTVQAFVSRAPDAETQTTANFTGYVNVRDYPVAQDGGWGYNSRATEVVATRTTAQQTINGTSATTSRTTYSCPAGYSPSNPSSYSSTSCSRTVTVQNSCTPPYSYSFTSGCSWTEWAAPNAKGKCPAGFSPFGPTICYKIHTYNPGTTTTTYYSYPNVTTEYNYFCANPSGWSGWTTGGSPCTNYYVCPGGTSAGAGWYTSASQLRCNSWQCLYGAPPTDNAIYVQSTPPKCEWRCAGPSGSLPLQAGRRPYLAQNVANKTGTGELRCFTQPSFQLICRWDTGATTTDLVTGNGNYCLNARASKPAGAIGTVVYATLTPSQSGGWQPANPQPGLVANSSGGGTRQIVTWGWNFIPGTNSSNVVGMPYVKVYGGDVRVGLGPGATSQTCGSNNGAQIKTYSTATTGSGTQFAAMAGGFIDRFVSGQYNPLSANPDAGNMPTKLTFANNAGGSGYGGGFGAAGGACYNYVEKLPDNTIHSNGPTPITGHGIGVGALPEVRHVKGDAFISGNITYNSGVRNKTSQIPLFELVVEGNIYIDARITQLDGLYVAIPTSATAGGNIYTCAFVSGASATLPSTTFQGGVNNCKRQLVVNGAFAAKQIKFGRDCGSLMLSPNNEPNTYFGGADQQNCGGSNHAAEVFNFTPEIWLRSSSGGGSTKYDSISSLPPIL